MQIGSALGSTLGQMVRLPESRLRILVACGAAGGISATFNAPIAGVFFALELILRDFEADSFGVVVLSSFAADIIGRAAFGSHPFLALPAFQLARRSSTRSTPGSDCWRRSSASPSSASSTGPKTSPTGSGSGPEWLRPAAGGLLLGLMLLALPQLYGVGYPPLEKAIHGNYVGLAVAPSARRQDRRHQPDDRDRRLGRGVRAVPVHRRDARQRLRRGRRTTFCPASRRRPGAYGLVGMGAVFAGAARAPITAVIIIFELTGDYRIILPLMFAIALATGISQPPEPRHDLHAEAAPSRHRRHERAASANLMQLLSVAEAMQPLPASLPAETPLNEVIERLAEAPTDGLPVVDDDGAYRGTVGSAEVEQAMRENALDARAGDLVQDVPALTTLQSLEDALAAMLRAGSGLPVIDAAGGTPVGWLTHIDVLRAYNARLTTGIEHAEAHGRPAGLVASGRMRGALARLRGYRVVELNLASGGEPVGRLLGKLPWPDRSHVLALSRDGETVEPHPDEMLRQGDRLTVLVQAADAETLADTISSTPDHPSASREP